MPLSKKAGWAAILLLFASCAVFSHVVPSTAALAPPEWVGVYDVLGRAGLLWIKVPGVARYKLFRRTSKESSWSLLTQTESNRYNDDTIQPGITYHFRLVGVAVNGMETPPSAEITFTVKAKGQEVLRAPRWEGHLLLERSIGLKWESLDSSLVVAYNIYRASPPEGKEELLASTRENTYSDYKVEPEHSYRYRVTALDGGFRETPPSEGLTVTYQPRAPQEEEKAPQYSWAPQKTTLLRMFSRGGDKGPPLSSPTDLVLSEQGLLYVADSGNGIIQVLTRDGLFRYAIPIPPSGENLPPRPLGLALDKEGRLYCTDAYTGRVLVFDARGQHVRTMSLAREEKPRSREEPSGEIGEKGKIKEPLPEVFGILGVCLGEGGETWVVDNANHRLGLFGPDGRFLRYMGLPGLDAGQLTFPAFCRVDAARRLMVTEPILGRVQFFDADGRFLKAFGRYGRNVGGLARPKGMAVDAKGRIYLADSWLCQIQVFDEDGRFLFVLADEEGKPLDLGAPNGIFLDAESNIYIAERLANRVQIRHIKFE